MECRWAREVKNRETAASSDFLSPVALSRVNDHENVKVLNTASSMGNRILAVQTWDV